MPHPKGLQVAQMLIITIIGEFMDQKEHIIMLLIKLNLFI